MPTRLLCLRFGVGSSRSFSGPQRRAPSHRDGLGRRDTELLLEMPRREIEGLASPEAPEFGYKGNASSSLFENSSHRCP
jgi:hypothetical protein